MLKQLQKRFLMLLYFHALSLSCVGLCLPFVYFYHCHISLGCVLWVGRKWEGHVSIVILPASCYASSCMYVYLAVSSQRWFLMIAMPARRRQWLQCRWVLRIPNLSELHGNSGTTFQQFTMDWIPAAVFVLTHVKHFAGVFACFWTHLFQCTHEYAQ